ncbi:hypothetical protein Maes01_00196 [Microbulbifer aestuariivivens]|uniref:Uncharacterized protein n=1 Tax=Microbulbifer aestuariivivens TaxID=1908308 RepID=A0ABP9WKB4_9GAMM
MKSLALFVAIIFLSVSGQASPIHRGEVTKEQSDELIEYFNKGATVSVSGIPLRALPKGLGDKIWRISRKEADYVVEIATEKCNKNGYEVFIVRYKCSVKGASCGFQVSETNECIMEVAYNNARQ